MLSFQELYNSMSNDQKLLLETGNQSIWGQTSDLPNCCVSVAVFAFHEMRQLAAGDMLRNAMANFEEYAYFLEKKELFRLAYLTVENKTKKVFDQIKKRIIIYKKILKGEVLATDLIKVAGDCVIEKMELAAARVAAYTINLSRRSAFWLEDCTILDYLKPFAMSMLYSILLLAKQLKQKLRLTDVINRSPDWFQQMLRQPKQSETKPVPEDKLARQGFRFVRQRNNDDVVIKQAKISKTEGNFKTIEIILEIEVRV